MPARVFCKAIAAITAVTTLALASVGTAPPLASRLAEHGAVLAAAAGASDAADRATSYIEIALARLGYEVIRRDDVGRHTVEVTVASPLPTVRTFIIGACYAPATGADGSGAAAVIELARLLKRLHPAQGTALKFVFFIGAPASGQPPASSFIAFAGGPGAAAQVRPALASLRLPSSFPSEGLATPAFVEGVTTSGPLMITGAALHYPYSHTSPEEPDYASLAADVASLARLIAAMAAPSAT